jgi:hypothetical protein
MDHERISARSEQMAGLLTGLVERLRNADDFGTLAQVVAEADSLMGHETEEWWVSLSLQRPGPPA